MKLKLVAIITTLAVAGLSAHAQSLIGNGNFELWSTTSGTPPTGTPTNWWTSPSMVQTTGLVAGSNYSATLLSGSMLAQSTGSASLFTLSFQFAATVANGSSAVAGSQGLLFNLTNPGDVRRVQSFHFIDAADGTLSLQSLNKSKGWETVATGIAASTYDSATGTWTTPTVNDFTLVSDWSSQSFSVTIGLHGGTQTTYSYSGLNAFWDSPDSTTLSKIFAQQQGTGGAFAFDNVSIVNAPEPGSFALVLGACGLLLIGQRLRRTSATENV